MVRIMYREDIVSGYKAYTFGAFILANYRKIIYLSNIANRIMWGRQ
jgi:hypothetical protein